MMLCVFSSDPAQGETQGKSITSKLKAKVKGVKGKVHLPGHKKRQGGGGGGGEDAQGGDSSSGYSSDDSPKVSVLQCFLLLLEFCTYSRVLDDAETWT